MAAKSSTETWIATWRSVMAADTVRTFGLGCSFIPETRPNEWFGLASDPRPTHVVHLELDYGLERARSEYNLQHLALARKSRKLQIGTRSGYQDLFVPVLKGKKLCGVLACGPVRTRRSTFEVLAAEWQELRGAMASTDDDGFLRCARAALQSQLFEGESFSRLTEWLQSYAGLLAGDGNVDRVLGRGWWARETLRRSMPELGMWQVSSDLVTHERNALWMASFKGFDRLIEGISQIPTHVIALMPRTSSGNVVHAVEHLLRVDRLQRALARFAASRQNVLAGRMGEEGAFLLAHVAGSRRERSRSQLQALAERAVAFVQSRAELGRGPSIGCGISERALHGGELPARYDEAVVAAKWATSEQTPVAFYADLGKSGAARPEGLYESSRALCRSFDTGRGRETSVGAERVLKGVLRLTGGNLEAARSHLLELAWEIATLVEGRQVADAVTVVEMRSRATEHLLRARAVNDLGRIFSELVSDFARLLEPPQGITLRVKLERARRFIAQDGYRKPLDFATLATRVGLSRSHLSRHFKKAYGMGLADFALEVRLEQSKKLLRESSLNVTAISHTAGFSSPSYFHQAFRRAEHETPQAYRKRHEVKTLQSKGGAA